MDNQQEQMHNKHIHYHGEVFDTIQAKVQDALQEKVSIEIHDHQSTTYLLIIRPIVNSLNQDVSP